jgi:hypothetical protein
MAYHQSGALRIVEEFSNHGISAIASVPGLTGYYPPLYHSVVAAFYTLFGTSPDVGRLANLPATIILMGATFAIGRTVLPPLAAALAAVLVGFYPILIWISREAVIDYWLTGVVTLAVWLLLRTEDFAKRRESVAFGVICGLGLLTKTTFPAFVGLPSLWAARKNHRNAAIAACIALTIAAYWYIPQWDNLKNFYLFNSSSGASEGDPPLVSLQALLFYPRAMEGYQLFLPLFILFILGAIRLARNWNPAWMPIVLWIASGWIGLVLMQNKDPKYTAPLLPAVALITAYLFERRTRLVALLLPFLVFQHYLVSFGIRQLPDAVVLAKGVEGPHTWNWNLYTQQYYGIWGKPVREDWRIDYVLDKVSSDTGSTVRIGMIPDIPCFDALAFDFQIQLRKANIVVNRLWSFDETAIQANDYILMSERDQGFAKYYAPDLDRINGYILARPEKFVVMEWFPLPNGEVIRLYKVLQTNV